MHFQNKNSGSLKKKVSYFRKLWPEKNFWDYQTVALSAQSAGTGCEPCQCCPRSRLEQLILVCGFPGRQIYLWRRFCCAQSRGCEDPSWCWSWCWLGQGVTSVADSGDMAQPGRSGAAGRLWLPAVAFLQLWSKGWACLCLFLLKYCRGWVSSPRSLVVVSPFPGERSCPDERGPGCHGVPAWERPRACSCSQSCQCGRKALEKTRKQEQEGENPQDHQAPGGLAVASVFCLFRAGTELTHRP